jgi:hypothetical protein
MADINHLNIKQDYYPLLLVILDSFSCYLFHLSHLLFLHVPLINSFFSTSNNFVLAVSYRDLFILLHLIVIYFVSLLLSKERIIMKMWMEMRTEVEIRIRTEMT